jgi:hypothetical protein
VAQLLAPYAAGGAAALQSPLHASVQRWGSALYPVPDGAHNAHQRLSHSECTFFCTMLCVP